MVGSLPGAVVRTYVHERTNESLLILKSWDFGKLESLFVGSMFCIAHSAWVTETWGLFCLKSIATENR